MSKTKKRTGKEKDFISKATLKDLKKFLPIRNEARDEVSEVIEYHQTSNYLVNEGYIFKLNDKFINTLIILNLDINKKITLIVRGVLPIPKFKGNITIYMKRNDLKITKLSLFNMKLVDTSLTFKEHLGGFTYKFVSKGFLNFAKYKFSIIDDITKDKEWEQMLKLK